MSVDGTRSDPDALCVPSRLRYLPLAVAAVQVAMLTWVVLVWGPSEVPLYGTRAAVLAFVIPPFVFGAVALFGWWALRVASPKSGTVHAVCWTIEGLTGLIAALFFFELMFGLAFGGILGPEL